MNSCQTTSQKAKKRKIRQSVRIADTAPPQDQITSRRVITNVVNDRKTAQDNLLWRLTATKKSDAAIETSLQTMRGMWATSTWATRGRLWHQLNEFCCRKSLEVTPLSAVAYLETLTIAVTTKLTYARNLMAIFNGLQMNTNAIKFRCKTLLSEGAAEPIQ